MVLLSKQSENTIFCEEVESPLLKGDLEPPKILQTKIKASPRKVIVSRFE
jgi:hypothetical protein